jgi:hypothetical protein
MLNLTTSIAQGSRGIIVAVQVGAVKIYVGALEAAQEQRKRV